MRRLPITFARHQRTLRFVTNSISVLILDIVQHLTILLVNDDEDVANSIFIRPATVGEFIPD